jgi:hypothetical protein
MADLSRVRAIHRYAVQWDCTMVEALNRMLAEGTARFEFEHRYNVPKNPEGVRLNIYGPYTVSVATASHDELKAGITNARTVRVRVWAKSDSEAVLLATQMAACNRSDRMPTSALLTDWPED